MMDENKQPDTNDPRELNDQEAGEVAGGLPIVPITPIISTCPNCGGDVSGSKCPKCG